MSANEYDRLLIQRIREGDDAAWDELIGRFEGRLLAFVNTRLHNRAAAEDVVQETFVGFLTSLPNFDQSRSLESWLFTIASHKLTDHLRREGRRPTVPLSGGSSVASSQWDLPGTARAASSIHRSQERRGLEHEALAAGMAEIIEHWRKRGDWEKICCLELILVRGWANKDVAARLGLSEQAVANHKFDFLAKLRTSIRKQGLNHDVFPELRS